MSTRGTYKISLKLDDDKWLSFYLYIHHDNYPEGAAMHFQEALDLKWKHQVHGKTFAKRFLAIDGSEFTLSNEAHGDTE